jgi:hypothetical protein
VSNPDVTCVFLTTLPVKHVPEWCPGAGFKKTAKQWLATVNELAEKPYKMVKDQMVTVPCFFFSPLGMG